MPNLIVRYARPPDESVADAMDRVREAVAEKQNETDATFARDPAWTEEANVLTARWPYKFSSPGGTVLEPFEIKPVAEEAPEPVEPKRRLFKRRKNS